MIKLKVDSKRNLSFIERDRILQGEHKFDTLQIALPEKIDSNDEYVSGMLIKIFFVHDKDRVTRQVIPDQNLNVETVIDYTLTEKARRWLVYVCFYKVGDEDIEVGKTNPVAVSVNHIPYNEALDIKSKDPDILLFKGEKGDKGDKGDTGAAGADWVPTATEKSAIASEAAGMINVPTKTSQLQNDSGFLTQHQDISAKEDKSNKISAITSANRSSTAQYTTPKAVADFVGQFYTPEQYGAKGDGVTDDKSAIEAMLADIPDNALCVFYGNYYISAGITITRPVNITMYGKIVVAPTADFCMRISGHDVRKNTFRLNLETTSISGQWDGTYHTIGLDLYSTWENTVDVNVRNFNVGVRLISGNRDCTYNKLFIRYIFDCKTAILLTGDSTLFGGTTAQNTFVGGRVGASGYCLDYLSDSDTEDCYFPLNSELVRGRTNNNNNFVSVSFECGFAKDIEGKTNRAKINANYNYGTMIGCRFEGVTSFYGDHYISLVGGYGFDNIPNKSGGYSAIGVNDMHVNGYTAPIKIARNGNGGDIVEVINANGNKVWSLDSNGYSTNRAILLSPNEQAIIFPTSFMKIRGVAASNPTAALTALSNFEWGLSNYGFLVLKNSTGKGFIVQPIYTSAPPNPVAGTHALINGKPMWFNGDEWVYANGDTAFSIPTIVSGVVNQNGTITFTDSDGNTFTTSGSSVIGDDGFSPTATVTQTQSGATVSITDKNGTTTANISNGADGQDYVLTSQDKTDIANIVLQLLPTTQGVLYGNTSN